MVSKEDSEKSIREILMEKLDTKGDKKNAENTVDRLIKKFFLSTTNLKFM